MTTTTIRPGILIALRTAVLGGVEYRREELSDGEENAANENTDNRKVEVWRTKKITADVEEHAFASQLRSLMLREVTKLCMSTSFGLLAPESAEAEIDAAHKRARVVTAAFNETARYTRITFGMLKGRVAASDAEAVRAITAELGGLVADMNSSIDKLDVAGIRAAAGKAASLAAILGDEEKATVTAAVEAARKAARAIVKRVASGGEPAAVVLADLQRGALERARVAFADFDDAPDASGEQMPAADMARAAGIDLDASEPTNEPPVVEVTSETPAPETSVISGARVEMQSQWDEPLASEAPARSTTPTDWPKLPTIDWD